MAAGSFVTNKVIANAVKEEFQNQSAILQLGVMDVNASLQGKGVGDTIQLTTWHGISEGLQEFAKGDTINFEEVSQTSKEVKVKQFVKGTKVFSTDEKFAVSGEQLVNVATTELTNKFTKGIDVAAMETLLQSQLAHVDATAGLDPYKILDNILKTYGEAGIENTKAVVVHPAVAGQLLMGDATGNFVSASTGYGTSLRYEVGKLFNQIPVVMSDRVTSEVVDGDNIYKSLIVPNSALTYVLAEDVVVESDRDIATKFNFYSGSMIYAMSNNKDAIVMDTVVR